MKSWFIIAVIGVLTACDGVWISEEEVAIAQDLDGDGFTDDLVAGGTDCDDSNARVNPEQPEVCNGVDDDCDGEIDEEAVDARVYMRDQDADGYPTGAQSFRCAQADGSPPLGYVEVYEGLETDCDDLNAQVSPAGREICNGIDDDCDEAIDDRDELAYFWFYRDADEDGAGDGVDADGDSIPDTAVEACASPSGYVATAGDCVDDPAGALTIDGETLAGDEIYPGHPDPPYDGVDQDCSGDTDFDADGDGEPCDPDVAGSPCYGLPILGSDCDDTNPAIHPGADESVALYDGIDDDCDGGANDNDGDGDGFGCDPSTASQCAGVVGIVGTDCNDDQALIHPAAEEIYYDGIDQNCDDDSPADDHDADGDGVATGLHGAGSPDCDDEDATIWKLWALYEDVDADGWGGVKVDDLCGSDESPQGFVVQGGDCLDSLQSTAGIPGSEIHPGAEEIWYDGVDGNCAGDHDYDQDGDGYVSAAYPSHENGLPGGDCVDTVEGVVDVGGAAVQGYEIFPGAVDLPYTGVDEDCDGAHDFDQDGDGFVARDWDDHADQQGDPWACEPNELDGTCPGDCDDTPAGQAGTPGAQIHPGATENWYAAPDRDCDGNDFDQDYDGYVSLAYSGHADQPQIAPEACDPADGSCPGDCDDNPADDAVYDTPLVLAVSPEGLVAADIHPGQPQRHYNGINDSCATAWTRPADFDQDRDGFVQAGFEEEAMRDPVDCVPGPNELGACPGDCEDDPAGQSTGFGAVLGVAIHPLASETYYDDIDQDCAGEGIDDWDQDGDGFTVESTVDRITPVGSADDCHDQAAQAYPGKDFVADDVQDGLNSDCDAEGRDECFADLDQDGFGRPAAGSIRNDADGLGCNAGDRESALSTDCNDSASNGGADIYPGKAFEPDDVQDGRDNDCSGGDECFADSDRDGFGNADPTSIRNDQGTVGCKTQEDESAVDGTDCDDQHAKTHVGAAEADDPLACMRDDDQDGYGDAYAPSGVVKGEDCVDSLATTEVVGVPQALVPAQIHPAAIDTRYDGFHQDCATAPAHQDYDKDRDGYVHEDHPTQATSGAAGCVPNGKIAYCRGDCDDASDEVNEGMAEIWYDGTDQNCDGNDADQDGDGLPCDPDFLWYDPDDPTGPLVSSCPGAPSGGVDCHDDPGLDADFTALAGLTATDIPINADVPWDGIDADCTDLFDEWDYDGDGYETDGSDVPAPNLAVWWIRDRSFGDDCDDAAVTISPGASEVHYNTVDENCDPADEWDQDGDGYTKVGAPEGSADDCDDSDGASNPGNDEIPNNFLDDDCNPLTPEGWGDKSLIALAPNEVGVDPSCGLEVGDFDGDLQADLVVCGTDGVYVFFGPLGQNPGPNQGVRVRDSATAEQIASADTDGDGVRDLVILDGDVFWHQGPVDDAGPDVTLNAPAWGLRGVAACDGQVLTADVLLGIRRWAGSPSGTPDSSYDNSAENVFFTENVACGWMGSQLMVMGSFDQTSPTRTGMFAHTSGLPFHPASIDLPGSTFGFQAYSSQALRHPRLKVLPDLNGDGIAESAELFPDLVLPNGIGRVKIRYGPVAVGSTGLDLRIDGDLDGIEVGHDVAVGDFNGDGLSDLVVSAMYGSNSQGEIRSWDGAIGGSVLNFRSNDNRIRGDLVADSIGRHLAVGDLGSPFGGGADDGFDDLVITTENGSAFVVYGVGQ